MYFEKLEKTDCSPPGLLASYRCMEKPGFTNRAMADETIIGGPFVRYLPDPGTTFMIVGEVGEKEFIRAFCPRVIHDRWGCFTVGAFVRCGCDETENWWIERIHEEVLVTNDMIIYQVPIEQWMKERGSGQ